MLQKQEKVNQLCEGGQEIRGRAKDWKAQKKHARFHGSISSMALNQVNQSLWLTLDFHLCNCMFHPVCAALSALAFLLCTLSFLEEERTPSSPGISELIRVGGTVSSDWLNIACLVTAKVHCHSWSSSNPTGRSNSNSAARSHSLPNYRAFVENWASNSALSQLIVDFAIFGGCVLVILLLNYPVAQDPCEVQF